MVNPITALFGNRTIIVNQGLICMGNSTHEQGSELLYASEDQVALIRLTLKAIAQKPDIMQCKSMEDAVEVMEDLAQGKPTTIAKLRFALATMGAFSHTIAGIKQLIDSFTA